MIGSTKNWSLLAASVLVLAACTEENPTEVTIPGAETAVVVSGDECADLLAGQFTDAGDVCVSIDGEDLVVTYTTTGGWELEEAHLWVGENQADMPQTRNGNPKIGNFPYNSGDITGATTQEFRVPLSTWGLSSSMTSCPDLNLIVAAHAAVRKDNGDGSYQTETGWGDGFSLVDRGSWATAFGVTLQCEDVNVGGPGNTETAFAYGSSSATCFLDISGENFNRWGWTNGPLTQGTYTFEIHAGAAQCDLSKGTLVGELTVNYSGSTATVNFNIDSPYYLTQTHLYVGNAILATKNGEFTVAPGQYPTIHDPASGTSDSYTVSGLSGEIYVVAHATVGGF